MMGVIVQIQKPRKVGRKGVTMDQPTAEQALREMEVLVGEWSQTATPASGEPWPGEARATFEWLDARHWSNTALDPKQPTSRATSHQKETARQEEDRHV